MTLIIHGDLADVKLRQVMVDLGGRPLNNDFSLIVTRGKFGLREENVMRRGGRRLETGVWGHMPKATRNKEGSSLELLREHAIP